MGLCTTPTPRTSAGWTASGACTSGSTARPRGAMRRGSGGAAMTSTTASDGGELCKWHSLQDSATLKTSSQLIPTREIPMLLVREVLYCKPGKVRPMVAMFQAMNKLGARTGMPPMRLMTDFCAERYWTLVAEMEVKNLEEFERMMQGAGLSSEDAKEFENISKGYHDLVEHGRREIYKIEG